ncbi:MAG: GTP-binding protein, partial [Coriobacteriia bacterium]|nr:GTP-binding protein [Coriobacteriia bacterium]
MGRCSFTQANNIDAFSPSAPSFVLGTAGHIDHGKSTLVRYLTGVDPDRLAEEKRRGITIELGFAQLVLPNGTQLGVVDVPGHERFVRHMVEGATGIDVALLVVAADDGVMVQTREHVSILELLGIRHLVVAVSKVDLTGADLAEIAVLDVAELLHDTPFADAEIVPVSGSTGQGVPELLAAIERAVSGIDKKALDAAVR